MSDPKSRKGAREENVALILAVAAGVALGVWAASKPKVLGEEKDALIAMAGAMVGLLAITLAAMTIVLGFLENFFGDLIEVLGLKSFFRPFKWLAWMSAAAALVSFGGIIDGMTSKTDVRSSIFGLATALTVIGILWSVILVNTLAYYATEAREVKASRERTLSKLGGAQPQVRGDETQVVNAFRAWLESEGWTVAAEVAFADLVADRAGQRLYVEVASPEVDVDAMYARLRRAPLADSESARFAIVVPENALDAVLGVRSRVRDKLRVEVYAVSESGIVNGPRT
jgi:hypothetical protein